MLKHSEQDRWLKEAAQKSFDNIDASGNFIAIYTNNFRKAPLCAMELGYALVTGKPIYLLAQRGAEIPPRLKIVATGVEWFDADDKESLKRATEAIAKSALGDSHAI